MGMKFVDDAYKALAHTSWAPTLPMESLRSAAPGDSKPKDHTVLGAAEEVSVDCKSWILGCFNRSASSSNRAPGYKRPTRLLRMFRRLKAKVRKSRGSCYRTVCVEPQPALHYYKTESYERNFDRGREFWADLPFLDITPLCSPLNQGSAEADHPLKANVGASPEDARHRRRNGFMESVPE